MAAIEQRGLAERFSVAAALKRTTFLALIVLTVVTVWIHEAYFFAPLSPKLARLQPFMPWLAPHIGAGAIALLLGPFQFSSTIRQRSLALHRWLGRAYMAAC